MSEDGSVLLEEDATRSARAEGVQGEGNRRRESRSAPVEADPPARDYPISDSDDVARPRTRVLAPKVSVSSLVRRIDDVMETAELVRIQLDGRADTSNASREILRRILHPFLCVVRAFRHLYDCVGGQDEFADTNLSRVRLTEHKFWTETLELLNYLHKKLVMHALSASHPKVEALELRLGVLEGFLDYFRTYCVQHGISLRERAASHAVSTVSAAAEERPSASPPTSPSRQSGPKRASRPAERAAGGGEAVADCSSSSSSSSSCEEEEDQSAVSLSEVWPEEVRGPNALVFGDPRYHLRYVALRDVEEIHTTRVLPELVECNVVVVVSLGERAAAQWHNIQRKFVAIMAAYSVTSSTASWWPLFVPVFTLYDLSPTKAKLRAQRWLFVDGRCASSLRDFWRAADTTPVRIFARLALPKVAVSRPFVVAVSGCRPVPCRFLAPFPHPFPLSGGRKMSENLILHVHGGGFVSLSSRFEESFTRLWVRGAGMPMISVDYRLAPEYRFPAALEDCYHAYQWVLSNCEVLGLGLSKIILVGDSAGGNLCVAVTLKAIADGLRVPDRLVLAYPMLNLTAAMVPSRTRALADPLVSLAAFRCCRDMYLDNEMSLNPLVSPVFAEDAALKRFPETFISVGGEDPLLDDSIMFAKRLHDNGVPVRVALYSELSHGYLNAASWCSAAAMPTIHLAKALAKPFRDRSRSVSEGDIARSEPS